MNGGRRHLRRAPLVLTAALAALAAASAPAAAAPTGQSPAEVRDYWTTARMLAAEPPQEPASLLRPTGATADGGGDRGAPSYVPADGAPAVLRAGRPGAAGGADSAVVRHEVTDPAAPAVRMHGKVFFTVLTGPDAGDRVCSGTVVNSRKRSLVWTAGHCVFSAGEYVSNWLFVPGFSAEGEPYGAWPAKRLATTSGWRKSANFRYDVGAAIVTKGPEDQRLQELVGARGIGFNQPRDQGYETYGYPSVADSVEFSGTREYRCVSANAGADAPLGSGPATMAIDCDMPAGASGGGWIAGRTLLSVTSYGYVNEPARLYGPYMAKAAKALYRKAAGKRKHRCGCGRSR